MGTKEMTRALLYLTAYNNPESRYFEIRTWKNAPHSLRQAYGLAAVDGDESKDTEVSGSWLVAKRRPGEGHRQTPGAFFIDQSLEHGPKPKHTGVRADGAEYYFYKIG